MFCLAALCDKLYAGGLTIRRFFIHTVPENDLWLLS